MCLEQLYSHEGNVNIRIYTYPYLKPMISMVLRFVKLGSQITWTRINESKSTVWSTLVQHACRVYFSGIRSRDRPARGSSSSMVSSSIAARHNGEVSQNGELNGERRRDNDGNGFCIVRKRDDSVSRVLSHSYSARDIAGTYLLRRV